MVGLFLPVSPLRSQRPGPGIRGHQWHGIMGHVFWVTRRVVMCASVVSQCDARAGNLCAWYRGVYPALLSDILGEDARGRGDRFR